MRTRRALGLFLAFSLLFCMLPTPARANTPTQAETLLDSMSPAEKVGQLFLITFNGSSISEGSLLRSLITTYHIGGFVLRADHDNFSGTDTLASTYDLIADMQTAAWDKSQLSPNTSLGGELPAYVPLFIGIEQNGNSASQILSGLSDQPNQMTLGATWSPSLAQQAGQVLGSELSALGFNLFLGPTLDVAETTSMETAAYSGADLYGADPYWVGEIGRAYIAGLHAGSLNRLSVIARHFPGLGSADRPPDLEVATVRKSLEQLKQIELAPFFAVTSAEDPNAQADGVMVSHIRFQGFQGNIRATTRPISFDATALAQLLAVEPLASWRSTGGLTVSDSLGSKAVRSFLTPPGRASTRTQSPDPLSLPATTCCI
jgi:Beta-glucosidase-related glycosidases